MIAFDDQRGRANGGFSVNQARTLHAAKGMSEVQLIAPALTRNPYADNDGREGLLIAHTLTGNGFDASEDGTGRGTPLVTVPTMTSNGDAHSGSRNEHGLVAVAYDDRNQACSDIYHTLRAEGGGSRVSDGVAREGAGVRRLTPRECERLMGWPSDHTRYGRDGKENADGPRYRMCGNGVAAPCAQWIASRIKAVEADQ